MKARHAFVIAVIANIVGAYIYDALKRHANANRL